ncbi:MAG: hypothetical protein K6G83_05265 [Lachnospiraceae bacterium]|nr:hypothetical protein [Lachnospiraceae bacterium]
MKKNFNLKKTILFLLFLILLLFSLWYCNTALRVRTMHGSSQAEALYYQPKDTIDVVMLGSSHVHCDINTGLLFQEYGIAAYDYSAAEQPLWCTYYYLKEICKTQKPKLIVLELYSPARFKDDHQYGWLNENLCGMRFSLNKLQMLFDSCERERLSEFFPSFFVYHSRYSELTRGDMLYPLTIAKEKRAFKGFTPFFGQSVQERPPVNKEEKGGLTAKSELYLEKIIEYTKENEIPLFLLVSPYIMTWEDQMTYNRIEEIAAANELFYRNANDDYDMMALDFSSDFNEESHLNYQGACKYSRYLGYMLKLLYELPDRRTEPGYESWAEDYERIMTLERENSNRK